MKYFCDESANLIEGLDVDFSINDPSDLNGMMEVMVMGMGGTVSHTRPRYT